MAKLTDLLFVMKTLGGPRNIVLDRGPDRITGEISGVGEMLSIVPYKGRVRIFDHLGDSVV